MTRMRKKRRKNIRHKMVKEENHWLLSRDNCELVDLMAHTPLQQERKMKERQKTLTHDPSCRLREEEEKDKVRWKRRRDAKTMMREKMLQSVSVNKTSLLSVVSRLRLSFLCNESSKAGREKGEAAVERGKKW